MRVYQDVDVNAKEFDWTHYRGFSKGVETSMKYEEFLQKM